MSKNPAGARVAIAQSVRIAARQNLNSQESMRELLERYLKLAGFSQAMLARELVMPQSVVSGWTSRESPKVPTRENILKIARYIDSAIRPGGRKHQDAVVAGEDLGTVLISLLRASGSNIEGRPVDVQWEIARNDKERSGTLNIGWTACPPLVLGTDFGPRGLGAEIAVRCARLMGFEPRFSLARNWSDLIDALRLGQIDVIAPIVAKSPHYGRDIAFSEPIGLMLPHVLVARKDAFGSNRRGSGSSEEALQTGAQLSRDEIARARITTIPGTAPAYLFSKSSANSGQAPESVNFANMNAVVEYLLSEGDHENVLILTADPWYADTLLNLSKRLAIFQAPKEFVFRFPLCFAVRDNERTLLQEIDIAVDVMRRAGVLIELMKDIERPTRDSEPEKEYRSLSSYFIEGALLREKPIQVSALPAELDKEMMLAEYVAKESKRSTAHEPLAPERAQR